MGGILNNLTTAELSAIREHAQRQNRACVWCAKLVSMRTDQRFCGPACRAAFSRASAGLAYDALIAERGRWQQERAELLREIADLRSGREVHPRPD